MLQLKNIPQKLEVIVMSKERKSEIEKLYDQLGISPKSNELNEYSFFNSKKEDEHLAWKPLPV